MKRCWWICCILLAVLTASALAQEPALEGPPPPAAEAVYPGVAEVVPRLARVKEEAVRLELRLAALKDIAAIRGQIEAARQRQQELERRIGEAGDPEGWSFDRLQEVRSQLAEQRTTVKRVFEDLSERFAELERIRQEWAARETFWKGWESHLGKTALEVPRETMERGRSQIAVMLKTAGEVQGPLVDLQKEVTDLQAQNLDWMTRIGASLNSLREKTFKKTGPPFTSIEFYRQFRPEMMEATRKGILEARRVDWSFWQEQGGIPGLQVLVAIVVALLIIRHRRKPDLTREWQFIMRHPWATGIFVAMAALGPLYATPPTLWRFFLRSLTAVSASILVGALLRNPRKIFMVYLLAALYLLSSGLQLIDLPQPFYRLYLTLLALVGIPFLLVLSARNLRARQGVKDGFTFSLRLGAAILGVSLLAQLAGYGALASWLIEASVASVFLGLFVTMALRLGRGGIEFLLNHPLIRERSFIRRFGRELTGKLQGVIQALLIGSALLSLMVIWGIYDSPGQAWRELLDFGLDVGEVHVSLGMVFLVGLVLYLSIVFSWFLRAVLDTQVFPVQGFDRGVRDAIKKLLHYALVFIGFLLAMSLAGVELKNFAVLAGAFGIGIGFGLQNIVNNFISGIILLFERPIKVGDMVVLESEWGTVRKIGLRSTIVETLDQSEIIVPNSQLISEKVTNWTLSTQVARIVLPVGVAYGSNVKLVMSILREVAVQHPDVLSDPAPSPIFKGFGDSSLDFELRVWVSDITKRLRVISELNQAIDQGFRDGQVEIPFPQRDLHVRSVDESLLARTWGRGAHSPGVVPPVGEEPLPSAGGAPLPKGEDPGYPDD